MGGHAWGHPSMCPCPPATLRSNSPHRFFMTLREAASMADAPWMRVKDPASRLILQCDAAGRLAAGKAWGVSFSEEPCRARVAGARATLWLGPDEHLMWQASRDLPLPVEELEQALSPYP